jgi:sulfur relay (sulfurtransferase) complex TusBCD TusD component (DsrE family)
MKSNLGIVIYSNEAETVWNAFRLANFALIQKDIVKIFLLGKGVEAENLKSAKFDVKEQIKSFVAGGGELYACGTCLKIRNEEGSTLCPVSTLADLYAIIMQADKLVSF